MCSYKKHRTIRKCYLCLEIVMNDSVVQHIRMGELSVTKVLNTSKRKQSGEKKKKAAYKIIFSSVLTVSWKSVYETLPSLSLSIILYDDRLLKFMIFQALSILKHYVTFLWMYASICNPFQQQLYNMMDLLESEVN